MSDNIAVTPGIGTSVGCDEIAGVQYQRVKLIHGADGVNDGDIEQAVPLPVRFGLKLDSQLSRGSISVNASGFNTVVAAQAAKYIRIYALLLIATSTVTIELGDATTPLTGVMTFNAGSQLYLPQIGEPHFKMGAVNRPFVLNLGSGVLVSGSVWWTAAA